MDDELEKLLHELAGQERERLRRKHAKPVQMTTSHHNNRFGINRDGKHIPSLSRSFQNEASYLKTYLGDEYSEKGTNNNATCQMHPNYMTHSPFPEYSDDTQKLRYSYLSRAGLNSEFTTLNNTSESEFQLFSRQSQPSAFPQNLRFLQDISNISGNDIPFESNFARNLLYKGNNCHIPLNNIGDTFR